MHCIEKLIGELDDAKRRFTLEESVLMVWKKPVDIGWLRCFSGHNGIPDLRYLELDGSEFWEYGKSVRVYGLVLQSIGEQLNNELAEISRQAALFLPDVEIERYGVSKGVPAECRWLMCLFCFMKKNRPKWIELNDKPDLGGNTPGHEDLIKPCEASIIYLEHLAKLMPKKRRNRTKDIEQRNDKAWQVLNKTPKMSIRDLADILKCSPATVRKTKAWKHYQNEKNKEKGARKPQMLNLSDKSLQVYGREDDELNALMEDQKRDYEPSPFNPKGRAPINRKELQ